MAKKKYNKRIDVIIPAYNVPDKVLFRCLTSIACQDILEDVDITIVDDASTEQNYAAIAAMFQDHVKINILRYEENGGPGVARQYGLDHTENGYVTFIDADDTFNGAFSLKALRNGIEMGGGKTVLTVSVFDEVHELDLPEEQKPGPILIQHDSDLVWVFGKMYRRQFIDEMDIKFHPTSRANEDNGFNTIFRLTSDDNHQINFIPAHTYYWHESPDSITRHNDNEYSYGGGIRDSFYGYVENMIYAVKEAKCRCPYNGMITQWAVDVMLNIYEYYIECVDRASEHADSNWEWCKRYYKEIYADLESQIPDKLLAQQYNNMMRNAYLGDKLYDIIPCMGIKEFLNKLKNEVQKNED